MSEVPLYRADPSFAAVRTIPLFYFTLITGPRRSLSLERSDASVYKPQIRAHFETTAHGSSRVQVCGLLFSVAGRGSCF